MSQIKLNYLKWGLTKNKIIVPLYGISDIVGSFTVNNKTDGLYLEKYEIDKTAIINDDLSNFLHKETLFKSSKRINKIIGVGSPAGLETICNSIIINHSSMLIKYTEDLVYLLNHVFLEKKIFVLFDNYNEEILKHIKNYPNIISIVPSDKNTSLFSCYYSEHQLTTAVKTTIDPILPSTNKKKVTKFFLNDKGEISSMLTEEVDDAIIIKEKE